MMDYSKEEIEYFKEKKCNEPDCWNYCADGYTLCPKCLYGTSTRMPDDIIKILKDWDIIGEL